MKITVVDYEQKIQRNDEVLDLEAMFELIDGELGKVDAEWSYFQVADEQGCFAELEEYLEEYDDEIAELQVFGFDGVQRWRFPDGSYEDEFDLPKTPEGEPSIRIGADCAVGYLHPRVGIFVSEMKQ